MDGLLLKFNDDHGLRTGLWFQKLFSSIYQELDRHFWCFTNQPWILPREILDRVTEFEEEVIEPFEERCQTSIQLWRPKTLSKFALWFSGEFLELWAIKPEFGEASRAASLFSDSGWSKQDNFIQEHASIWLIYTDSTCWEIFAEDKTLLDRVKKSLNGKPWVEVFRSKSNQRGQAFGMAGLSQVWRDGCDPRH